MQHRPIIVDVNEDMVIVVVVEEILNAMLMIIILRIYKNGKHYFIAKSEISLRKMKMKIYRVNSSRLMKRVVIDME